MSEFHTDRDNHPELVTRNSRYGLSLFAIYVGLYAGFIALSVFFPKLIASEAVGGVNVAIVYGFGLIGMALVLALIYMYLCRSGNSRGLSGAADERGEGR